MRDKPVVNMERKLRHAVPMLLAAGLFAATVPQLAAAPAIELYEEDFRRGIPGWTAVQPSGSYLDGPMLWQYDIVRGGFLEGSNAYTDGAAFSPTRTAVMLINDAMAPESFTYTARLIAGDDDGFGLIFGYQDELTFHRVFFGRQDRPTGWPFTGWGVDRMLNGQITDLFGAGLEGYTQTFVNQSGRPFDVTIEVNAGNLTLTVVDDPEGESITYNLVENEPLAGAMAGQVGLFSWGMSGATPRGFLIQDPELSPTPLEGGPDELAGWTHLITRNSLGENVMTSGANGNLPLWGLGLKADGPSGLIENSDVFADNVAERRVDFSAPTMVTGDPDWSNYVYTARITTYDDDGFGKVFRFQNDNTFYRIAFRAQSSGVGIKQGLSIQKAVAGVYTEIAEETGFTPPPNVPMDIYTSINEDRLQVILIADPDSSAPSTHIFGPYDITGDTVDTGQIGIFSWAQYLGGGGNQRAGTEVDFVRVEELSGEGLIVASPFGDPTPEVGLNDFDAGSEITASVSSPVMEGDDVRHVATGWLGSGSVPETGTESSVTFNLDGISFISWQWETQYRLSVTAAEGGEILGAPAEPWHVSGSVVMLTAQADPDYLFAGWSGDAAAPGETLNLVVNRPMTVTALFVADSDGDGLPDDWETRYFGNLDEDAEGDPDGDGRTNGEENQLGTNPTVAEEQVVDDGLASPWENVQRDPGLPAQLVVQDLGPEYRGAFENSNAHRFGNDTTFVSPDDLADFASFQTPRVILRPEVWDEAWDASHTAQAEFSVGDNDGVCLYFRYVDEQNWYRVTVCGEAETPTRPRFGVSIQKRENGVYSELASDPGITTDPLDVTGFKKVRVTVTANGSSFEVRVIGWDALTLDPPDWNPAFERVLEFVDEAHPAGRAGFGPWGMNGFADNMNARNGIPIDSGMFADNFRIVVDEEEVFLDGWEDAPLFDEFPEGWSNPFAEAGPLEGEWNMSAHGTIAQFSNEGEATTGTVLQPRGDGEGPILLAPDPGSANYFVEASVHPFDDDGVGLVYDFQDTDNYARVMFVSEATADGRIPQGLSVSRKADGVWSDIVLGDSTFIYTPGSPFTMQFANNNGNYRLSAANVDDPENVVRWQWTDQPAGEGNRFGLATWGSVNAHFLQANGYALPLIPGVGELMITSASIVDGDIVMQISVPEGEVYNVERADSLAGSWETIATGETGTEFSDPLGAGNAFYRLVLTQVQAQ